MSSEKKLGVAFWGGMPPSDIVECAKIAEDMGLHSAWMAEGHGGDQFSILTACAAATKRILLGTAITVAFVRSAPTIALASATVDHFSNGRFILGLGPSHKVQVEPEHGLRFEKPIQRVSETVEIVRGLLRDGKINYRGSIYPEVNYDLWFPTFRKSIPIILSALYPKMLAFAGKVAEGAMLIWNTVERTEESGKIMRKSASDNGRDPSKIELVSLLPGFLHEDADQALKAAKEQLAFYVGFWPKYHQVVRDSGFAEEADAIQEAWQKGDKKGAASQVSDRVAKALTISGSPSDTPKRIEEYRNAGVDLPILYPGSPLTGLSMKDGVINMMKAAVG